MALLGWWTRSATRCSCTPFEGAREVNALAMEFADIDIGPRFAVGYR